MQTLDLIQFSEKYWDGSNCLLLKILSQLPKLDKTWLAGGAIRRTIKKQKLDSDFDFFFTSEDAYRKFFENIKEKFKITNLKQNDANLSFDIEITLDEKPLSINIQLIIISYYASSEILLDSFDYTLCQFATDGERLYCGDTSLFDVANNRIVVNKITYPVASLRRLIKYTKQGFYACGGALAELLHQSSELIVAGKIQDNFQYID
jgi:hypothetical protein